MRIDTVLMGLMDADLEDVDPAVVDALKLIILQLVEINNRLSSNRWTSETEIKEPPL